MRHRSLNTQVWRSQPVMLAVTFEAAILCDISRGLSYSWSLQDCAGLRVPLPPAVSTHRRTITVPAFFLEPGNYTALAKVGWRRARPPAQAGSHFPAACEHEPGQFCPEKGVVFNFSYLSFSPCAFGGYKGSFSKGKLNKIYKHRKLAAAGLEAVRGARVQAGVAPRGVPGVGDPRSPAVRGRLRRKVPLLSLTPATLSP